MRLWTLDEIKIHREKEARMADDKHGLRVAGTDLCVGDTVELISGGPTMTVAGSVDNEIRCVFFFRDGEGIFGEMASVVLPRHALKEA